VTGLWQNSTRHCVNDNPRHGIWDVGDDEIGAVWGFRLRVMMLKLFSGDYAANTGRAVNACTVDGYSGMMAEVNALTSGFFDPDLKRWAEYAIFLASLRWARCSIVVGK